MKKTDEKNQIWTIPNILTFFRIALVPLIFIAYFVYENHIMLGAVIILSGLSDVVDGFIARKFNMISDIGKVIDPFADKLTQVALIVCLATAHQIMFAVMVVFIFFEILKATFGFVSIKKTGKVISAKWFGKLTTVYLYESLFMFLIFGIFNETVFIVKMTVCLALIVLSSCCYSYSFIKDFIKSNEDVLDVDEQKESTN